MYGGGARIEYEVPTNTTVNAKKLHVLPGHYGGRYTRNMVGGDPVGYN